MEGKGTIVRNIEDEMKDSYLRYSMSVIISRALPDARDGLKPSQRRILYAMRQLNLSPGSKHRKCAKISGDTSGDFHPHGEQVIYPTLVRLAQDWVMRYPLIQGQGNFGSIDGDPPAAMRYTEARLTPASTQLMEDLDKQTVDFTPNYDETKREPVVLPAKFPNLLCNGSSGIAVGMATSIPPHNLSEVLDATVVYLDNPDVTIEDLMQHVRGPDFPTGGVICGFRGIKEAYHTGRGKVIVRAKIRVEEDGNRECLIVDEIPYNVNKSRLIEQIADLITKKVIAGIADLRDDSDKDGLRLVIDLKRGEMPEVIINQLYKHSDLQVTFGCNLLALDKGSPKLLNLKRMIGIWVDHRIQVIRRRTRFELEKAQARVHVLEGYLRALDCLDEVVKLIRESANRDIAREELVSRFSFSERQANAILDLRLYQLTGLEAEKIQAEYDKLKEKIEEYRAILSDQGLVRQIIKDELLAIQKMHRAPRKTEIVAMSGEMDMEDLIANEPAIITLSEDNYIKRMPMDTFRLQKRGGQGVSGLNLKREGDMVKDLYIANTHDYLLIFTNFGRIYWLKVWQIPESSRKSKGRPLVNLLEDVRPQETVTVVLKTSDFSDKASVFMVTKRGRVKKTALSEFSNPRRKGIWAIDLVDGDEMVDAKIVSEKEEIMLFTRYGMAVRFDGSSVRLMGRMARGVRGVNLRQDDDVVVGCEVVTGDESILIASESGYGKRSLVSDFRKTNRGGVGVRSIVVNERNGRVVAAIRVDDEEGLLFMSVQGQAVQIKASDIRVMGRSTQGVRLINLKNGDALVAVQKVDLDDADASDD